MVKTYPEVKNYILKNRIPESRAYPKRDDDKLVNRIKKIYAILKEVELDWRSAEKAINSFQAHHGIDAGEVTVWEGVAKRYHRRVKDGWPLDKKKELFDELLRQS